MKYLIFILFCIKLLTVSSDSEVVSSNNYCCPDKGIINPNSISSFSSTIPLASVTDSTSSTTVDSSTPIIVEAVLDDNKIKFSFFKYHSTSILK